MKKLFPLWVSLVLTICASQTMAADPQGDANLLYLQGRTRMLDGKLEEALPFFEKALAKDPENATLNSQVGEVYLRLARWEQAVKYLEKASQLETGNAQVLTTLGEVYTALKRYDEAKTQYKKVLAIDPADSKAALLLGLIEADSGKPEEGIAVLNKTIELNPDGVLGYFYRAKIYLEMENTVAAKADLEKAVALRPSFVEAGTALGLLYERLGENEDAIRIYSKIQGSGRYKKRLAQLYLQKNEFEKALTELVDYEKLEPDDYSARLKLALIYFELKQFGSAVERLQAILKEQPDADNVHFYLAAVYEEQKQIDKAIAEFKKVGKESVFFKESMLHIGGIYKDQGKLKDGLEFAKSLNLSAPEVVEFYDMHASFHEAQQKYQQAMKVVESGLKRFPSDERLLYFEGALWDKLGDRKKGMGNMRRILLLNPMNAQALNFLGYTLAEMGQDLEEAEGLVRKALSLRPNDGYIEDSLGWILFKRGKTDEAIASLQRALLLQPQEAIIYEHLGDLYSEKKNISKAREMYLKGVELSKSKDEELAKKLQSKVATLPAN